MKKIVLYILLAGLGLAACSENEMNCFEGEAGLHFNLSGKQLDSIETSFTSILENTVTLFLPIELEGYAADADRNFRLRVVPEGTTAVEGKHYEALAENYVLRQGEYSVTVPVKWLYTPDMDSAAVRLKLQIDISDGFVAGIPDKQTVLLVCSNILPSIPIWQSYYEGYMGPYSKVKHRYILSVLQLKEIPQVFYPNENRDQWRAYGMRMNDFFTQNVIMDENGNRIEPWIY